MIRWPTTSLLLTLASAAHADRVPEFTESARLLRFDPTHREFAQQVAIDGDWALLRVDRQFFPPDLGEDDVDSAVYLYRRQNAGNWVLDRQLTPWAQVTEWVDPGLALKHGIAAASPGSHLYELVGGAWVAQPVGNLFQGRDLEISGRRLLSGTQGSSWDGVVHEKSASGTWTQTATLTGEFAYVTDNAISPSLDLSGAGAIVANPFTDDAQVAPLVPLARTYRYANGAWHLDGDLREDSAEAFAAEVALRGNHAFVTQQSFRGAHVYLRQGPNNWSRIDRLDTLDSYNSSSAALEHGEGFVLQQAFNFERSAEVINVFKPDTSGGYRHVAILSRSDGGPLGGTFDISGRRIIVGATDPRSAEGAFVFELPQTLPTPRGSYQDSFEAGNAGSNWQPSAGSSFSIATVGGQRVYRQAGVAGEAASFTPARGVLGDQAIQAEITPRSFNGSDKWVGLATRQSDMNNYYYATLRFGTNRIELKRKVNGGFSTLASTALNVTPGQTYRVRLESIGPRHMVYVDDTRVLLAVDGALQQGLPGVIMYKAAADYDNVIVSPSHLINIRKDWFDVFEDNFSPGWDLTGRGRWYNSEAAPFLGQDVDTVEARAITGTPAQDQIVTVDVRLNSWGPGSAFAGVLLRYVDDANYVYAILRADNRLSLRRLVNGQPQVLAESPVPVQLIRWYRLRVEMMAGATRVFLDGVQRLSAGDVGAPSGRVGVMTNRAGAWFDRFHAYQP